MKGLPMPARREEREECSLEENRRRAEALVFWGPRRQKANPAKGSLGAEAKNWFLMGWAGEEGAEYHRQGKAREMELAPEEPFLPLPKAVHRRLFSQAPEFPFDPWPNGHNEGPNQQALLGVSAEEVLLLGRRTAAPPLPK